MTDVVRCEATLRHAHGVSRCRRDPFHADDQGSMEQHVGVCATCEDDDGYGSAPLTWTGYREVWST